MTWNGGPESHILHNSQSCSYKHVKQDWCETSEYFLRIWPKIRILTYSSYLGAQNDLQIRSPKPIFNTHLKVAPINLESKFNVNLM